ncbi:MAG: hypothetical protein M1832_004925 [Thelocarpon impressellum]|nr:MAG: hypothetical protein M1832_004925 [Thelocarpon impressellum]
MASSAPPPPRQASRWGSLLQQAVAGVESRLDNILAEGDDGQPAEPGAEGPKAEKQPSLKAAMSASPAPRGEKGAWSSLQGRRTPVADRQAGLSRASSNSRTHDRLQERLAKAMVKKDNARLEGAPSPTSSTVPSRTGTPAAGADSPRASSDLQEPGTSGEMSRASTDVNGQPASDSLLVHEPTQAPGMLGPYLTPERGPSSRQSMDSQASLRSTHSTRDAEVSGSRVPTNHTSLASSAEEYDTVIAQMRADHETAELRRQEETHSYMERIDALQAKLHYLSRETVDSARSAMASAPAGSLDKKLADKDEQIALLMEEGQNLSKMELKHTTAIKKLRAKAKEDERQLLHVQSKLEKSEREAAEHKERARRAETAEKRANERLKSVARLEKELEKVRSERDSAGALLSSLKAELAQAKTQAAEAEKKAQTGALEAERKVVADLRDDLSNAKIEKELCEERARADARAVREKADAERERAKAVEAELRSEQSVGVSARTVDPKLTI